MKKTVFLLLALFLSFSFIGCKSNKETRVYENPFERDDSIRRAKREAQIAAAGDCTPAIEKYIKMCSRTYQSKAFVKDSTIYISVKNQAENYDRLANYIIAEAIDSGCITIRRAKVLDSSTGDVIGTSIEYY